MSCCPESITTFAGVSSTTVPYNGARPTVTVLYYDNGQWVSAGMGTVVKVTGTQVIVDHGGPATGIIKLS
jgi:hypothetical protein